MAEKELKIGDRVVCDSDHINELLRYKPGRITAIDFHDRNNPNPNNDVVAVEFDKLVEQPGYNGYKNYKFYWYQLAKIDEKLEYKGASPEEDFFGKEALEEVPPTSGPDAPLTEDGNPFGHLKI